MTRRVVIGKRGNGDVGLFVSPLGVDAYTAADSDLVLGISSRSRNYFYLDMSIQASG